VFKPARRLTIAAMAPPASYLVAVLCCICVLLTTSVISSFALPEFALRQRSSNPPANAIGLFLDRKDVAGEGTEKVKRDLGAEDSEKASTTRRRASST
jgi:hypothetical protein